MKTYLKWLGWDSFQIQTTEKIIYIDPLFGTFDKTADLVLVSHGHRDHCNPEVLSQIREQKTVVLTSEENKEKVNGIGLKPGESFNVDSIEVTAVHAYNIHRRRDTGEPFHPKGFGVGWIIQHENKKIYFMGDTELIPEMKLINNTDILLVPVSGKFVMDIDEAVEAIKLLQPKITIPMHYGIVDGSYRGKHIHIELDIDTDEFKKKAGNFTEVVILNHNETFEF